jgi:hypothetical protein
MRKVTAKDLMREYAGVLNKLESHLGCVICRGPLTDGRCPDCQPTSSTEESNE